MGTHFGCEWYNYVVVSDVGFVFRENLGLVEFQRRKRAFCTRLKD